MFNVNRVKWKRNLLFILTIFILVNITQIGISSHDSFYDFKSDYSTDYKYNLKTKEVIHTLPSLHEDHQLHGFSKHTNGITNSNWGDQHDIYNRPWFNVSDIKDLGQTAYGCTSNDFNNDGYLDFAVSHATRPFSYATISIFFNIGLNFTQMDVYTFNKYIIDLDSGDYDNDGDIDLIFTYCEQNGSYNVYGITSMLYNDGNNNFNNETVIAWRGSGVPKDPEGRINPQVTSADYDNDGDIDLLIGDNSGKVELYLNDGSGNFTSAGVIYDFGSLSWGLTSADVDGDNNIDFFVTAIDKENHGHVYLKKNNGLPNCFDNNEGDMILNFTSPGASIQAFDFDEDGNIEFLLGVWGSIYLCYNNNGDYVQVYLGRLLDQEGYSDSLRLGGITVGDYNNDSLTDFVTGGVQGVVRLFVRKPGPWIFITRPKQDSYYLFDQEFSDSTLVYPGIVGKITIGTLACPEITMVKFFINNRLRAIDITSPFNWIWRIGRPFLRHSDNMKIKVVGYTSTGVDSTVEIRVGKTPIWLHLLMQFNK